MTDEPLTRTQWIDRRLREAILRREFRPGDRLVTTELAARYSMSPTPLREALQRLAATGWAIETGAKDVAFRRAIESAWRTLEATLSSREEMDLVTMDAAHREFHHATMSRCGSARLLGEIEELQVHSLRVQMLSILGSEKARQILAEHRKLFELAIEGDATGLAAEHCNHLVRTLEDLTDELPLRLRSLAPKQSEDRT